MSVVLEAVPGRRQLGVGRTNDVPEWEGHIRAVLSYLAVVSPGGRCGPEQHAIAFSPCLLKHLYFMCTSSINMLYGHDLIFCFLCLISQTSVV